MRPARLILGALLILAPLSPLALSAGEPSMKCCPLYEAGGTCCPDSSCSLSRCGPAASPVFTSLAPCVVPDRSCAAEPVPSGRLLPEAGLSPLSLAADPLDPPPRA